MLVPHRHKMAIAANPASGGWQKSFNQQTYNSGKSNAGLFPASHMVSEGNVGKEKNGRTPSNQRSAYLISLTFGALLCFLLNATIEASKSRTALEKHMERMAEKIVVLKHEARRAHALEIEGMRVEEELEIQKAENRRLWGLEVEQHHSLGKMEHDIRRLEEAQKEKDEEIEELFDIAWEEVQERKAESNRLRGRNIHLASDVLEEHFRELTYNIQIQSHEKAMEKYGPGPHRVAIKVELPEDEVFEGLNMTGIGLSEDTIVIELAPLDFMPHSIQIFLDQVSAGLWNDCVIFRNANHILQASPDFAGEKMMQAFVDSGLDSVKFQEYNHRFPHEKYTIGFGGRPGGSQLIINKENNTELHGPGGQAGHFGADDADPCFGKVVSGVDVIRWLSAMPTIENDNRSLMQRYIRIVSASII